MCEKSQVHGTVAFITGGANGIGKEYSEALLERGLKVSFSDIDEKTGNETLKKFQDKFGAENVSFYHFDVTDHVKFEEAFEKAMSVHGPVDIMVNNAGIMNEAVWEKMIDINVTAVVKGIKLAEAAMRKDKGGKGGRIINISSCVGLNTSCYVPIYSGTKHAVRAYTTSLATQPDIDAQGIQYAQLCPDPVDTEMVRDIDDLKINYYEEVKESFKDVIPPSRCVEALLQLLQLENMNGAILYVRKDALMYQSMERKDIGLSWNP